MLSLIISLFHYILSWYVINDDETPRIKALRYRLHHEIIQKKINEVIVFGFVTRNMPEFEEDEHWAVELSNGERQIQAINCRICGEYKYPFRNDNEKIQCQCVNYDYQGYDVYDNYGDESNRTLMI